MAPAEKPRKKGKARAAGAGKGSRTPPRSRDALRARAGVRPAHPQAPGERSEGVVPTFAEVTELKRGLEDLRVLARDLEQGIAQRTSELRSEIARRVSVEGSLAEERNFVSAVLDVAPALVLVLDRAGRIVRFNKACEEASGLAFENVRGERWERLVPPEERDAVRPVFEELRSGVRPNRFENHWIRPDGTRRLIVWSNTFLLDPKGAVEYVIATGIDMTEQETARREAERRRDEVARLHRLHASGALAALVAHELNQPLAAIASYAESSRSQLRRGESVPEVLGNNLELIAQQAERASRTIGELRRFLAKDEDRKTPVDLNGVARMACALVEVLAAANGIRLRLEPAEGLLPVLGQAIQLEHVIVNLLQNSIDAIKDAAQPEGTIVVRTQREGAGALRVSVEDDGPGVRKETALQVFEPLFTTKTNGVGLGLSICRSLVEAHGGRIWAEPGPGGRFHFTLPVAA